MAAANTIEELVPNAQLGHYIILEHLADGGMGHVYKAFEPSLNREVAVKVLKPELANDEQHVGFFEGEAQKLAGLRHPNIVPIYFIGSQGKLFYFVMAFVAGGATLDNWVDTNTPLSVEQSFWVMGQAIDALNAAFQRNIIHLDIKPSNFLVDAKGESILLTDFGLARSLSEISNTPQERESFGTPAYMCPEQVMNQPTDQRSDIYSLGATMYHLMTTKLLYDRENIEDILVSHCQSPFPYKEAEASGLTPGWINLFDRMTQKKPEDRFQNYDELKEALAHVDQLTPVNIRIPEQTQEYTPVPNRSNESKKNLYGLLSPACLSWADGSDSKSKEGKEEVSVHRSRSEVLDLVNKPIKPLDLAPFTEALLEFQQEANPDIEDLYEALEMMPDMKDFILKLSNTDFFKKDKKAAEITDSKIALITIGLELSHHLILTNFILRKTPPVAKDFNWWPLIQHSMSVALVSTLLIHYFKKGESGRIGQMTSKLLSTLGIAKTQRLAYLAGFVHDIGKFVLGEVAAYSYYVAMRQSMEKTKPLYEEEKLLLGVTHHEIGEIWCSQFGFESAVKDVVGNHHNGQHKSSTLRSIVFIANQLVKRCGLGFSGNAVVETKDFSTTLAWHQLLHDSSRSQISPQQFESEFIPMVNQLPLLPKP